MSRNAVFGTGRQRSNRPGASGGMATPNGTGFCNFRNWRKAPDGENVTARLLGDPSPDRVVPAIPEDDSPDVSDHPNIHLTFRAMRAAYGETK